MELIAVTFAKLSRNVTIVKTVNGVHMHVNVLYSVVWQPNNTSAKIFYYEQLKTRMCANAQRDGRPAKYMWRPLFNAAKFG